MAAERGQWLKHTANCSPIKRLYNRITSNRARMASLRGVVLFPQAIFQGMPC